MRHCDSSCADTDNHANTHLWCHHPFGNGHPHTHESTRGNAFGHANTNIHTEWEYVYPYTDRNGYSYNNANGYAYNDTYGYA